MAVNIEEILALPEEERRLLRQILDDSLAEGEDFELTEEEWAELERRAEAYRQESSNAVPAGEVMEKLRQRYAD